MLQKVILTQNTRKPFSGWGSAPDPAGGAYSAPPDPIAGGEGAGWTPPQEPYPPLSALQASRLLSPHSKIRSDAGV